MPENEPSNMTQKQNPESGKTAPESNEVSTTIKVSYNLQPGQSSDDSHDVSKSHEEERNLSCKNEKDSDMLLQEPTSNPPLASHPMRDEKALEKVKLVRNMDAVDYRSQSNQGITASTLLKDFAKIPKDEPDNLHLRQSPDSGAQTSGMCDGERTSVKREMVSDVLLPVQIVKAAPASHCDKQKLIYSTRPEKAVEKLQPRRNPDTGGCNSHSYQVIIPSSISESFPSIKKEESQFNNIQPRQILDARNHDALLRKDEKCTTEKRETDSDNLVQVSSLRGGVPVPQSDQEKFTYSTKFEKVEKLQPRRNPDPVVQGLQSESRSTLSKVLEKGLHDGYNWRKYGQKLVKGNKFIRSYYKCTFLNCQAKKQVERSYDGSYDGCNTDVNYLGMHHHEKPQHGSQVTSAFQVQTPETPIASAKKIDPVPINDHGVANLCMVPVETSNQSIVPRSADDVIGAVPSSINDNNTDKDDNPDSKRQKRETISADNNVVNKPHSDLRHVVQTLSEVDIVNDGYRWRKYGQKLVKGNPNPRSYYRCSNAGCPAKKHVERASHDPKVVITTYEGQHDHEMPPSRPVSQSTARDGANMITTNGESRSKPDENNPVSLEMVVHVTAN